MKNAENYLAIQIFKNKTKRKKKILSLLRLMDTQTNERCYIFHLISDVLFVILVMREGTVRECSVQPIFCRKQRITSWLDRGLNWTTSFLTIKCRICDLIIRVQNKPFPQKKKTATRFLNQFLFPSLFLVSKL